MTNKTYLDQLSNKEVIKSLYFSQGFILLAGIIFALLFIEDPRLWFESLWKAKLIDIIVYGFGTGFLVVLIEYMIDKVAPKRWFEDDGVNERVFQALSYPHVIFSMAVVAFSEEILFRGLIQYKFGMFIASMIFAFVHWRYIKKPLLLLTVIILGFYLGWLFETTGQLLVPIAAHYTIDAALGIILKWQSSKRRGA
ncbi:membrane protease YdiL (CAAX protease family) [Scopulibacillus daqui]|uniref:Membrane protease YdiL (CAAX protease family) n=1 Tax=Scopulibacillus daqui TaxID=1469162 RepID=A0ABS2PZ62_9BACL|nr:CPBP family intramembrane glutamic endopeptidase [Scopulibacillus daqui]MBM7645327.1 membrane protease YdiL (CAAX protease family) [Scopulibacillus daqui]